MAVFTSNWWSSLNKSLWYGFGVYQGSPHVWPYVFFFFLNNTCNPHHKRPSWSTRHVNLLHLLTFGWFLSTFAVFDKGTLLKTESVSRWCVNYTNLDRFHGSSVVFFEWTNEEATCGHVPVTANYHCLFPDYAHLNKTVSDFLRAWLET